MILASAPLWFNEPGEPQRFKTEVETYQHTKGADGGYLSANFTVKVPQKVIDEWLENGLGRDIVVYSGETEVVFEGFVNRIMFGIGALSANRGPLFDIANRVSVTYTPIFDPLADPPITGAATETPIAEDSDSQDRYGILEKIVSGGQLVDDGTTDEAEEIRDMYLAEYKLPYTDESINLGQMTEPTMTVECLGYSEWLSTYVYNDYTETTVTLDAQIKNILNADPNGIFSTNHVNIDENLLLTNRYENGNKFAHTIIKEIVAQGDASDNRWVYGVGMNRLPYYRAVPTEVEYLHSLTSSSQNITNLDGTAVMPWIMPAGVWMEITDFMTTQRGYSSSIQRQNPRVMFAERVVFTAPHTLSVVGGRITTVRQRLAQLGVGGI
jgi:hypothetical protein